MKIELMKNINLEITYPKKYIGKYEDIIIPEGWRLPEFWELVRIVQSEYRDFILDYERGKWIWFVAKCQLVEDIRFRVLGRDGDGRWGAGWCALFGSLEHCRVVFVRDI